MLYLKFLCINEMLAVVVGWLPFPAAAAGDSAALLTPELASPLSTTISCRS